MLCLYVFAKNGHNNWLRLIYDGLYPHACKNRQFLLQLEPQVEFATTRLFFFVCCSTIILVQSGVQIVDKRSFGHNLSTVICLTSSRKLSTARISLLREL